MRVENDKKDDESGLQGRAFRISQIVPKLQISLDQSLRHFVPLLSQDGVAKYDDRFIRPGVQTGKSLCGQLSRWSSAKIGVSCCESIEETVDKNLLPVIKSASVRPFIESVDHRPLRPVRNFPRVFVNVGVDQSFDQAIGTIASHSSYQINLWPHSHLLDSVAK